MNEEFICPDELVCMDIETWNGIVEEYDLAMDMTEVSKTSDVQAVVDLSWQLLFLTPWELIYIGLTDECIGILWFVDIRNIQMDTKKV